MRQKMILDREVVKYIFAGVHSGIALGEDGYIVYDFDTTYPSKLAVFVPIEVEPSNYSNFFPKSFEDYFRDLDIEISRLSLLFEKGNVFNRFPVTEFVAGQILRRENSNYIVFRFDESIDPIHRTDLLCRSEIKKLSLPEINQIYCISSEFKSCVTRTLDGIEYMYWFLPVKSLFKHYDSTLEAWIPMMMESLCR